MYGVLAESLYRSDSPVTKDSIKQDTRWKEVRVGLYIHSN